MKKFMVAFLFLSVILDSPSNANKTNATIVIPLTIFTKHSSFQSKTHNQVVSASLTRSRCLKQRKSSSSLFSTILIYPRGYGALIPLSFGTPRQTLQFIFDTGSSLTWFPCGPNYSCYNCSFSGMNPKKKIPTFHPSLSSSSKIIGCNHPKSQLFVDQRAQHQCQNCKANNSKNCLRPLDYEMTYAKGLTSGILLSETLSIRDHNIKKDFIVGCSLSSRNKPTGLAGFGRGFESLPSQLGIKRFSYCLSGNQFNNNQPQRSYLVLNGVSHSQGLIYTPFLKLPPGFTYAERYYVMLKEIIVGHKAIEIPQNSLAPNSNGYGGTMVDSGTTFTYMESSIYKGVTREFEKQMGKDSFIGYNGDSMPCFNVTGKEVSSLPNLAFRFKGRDALMKLPLRNYLMDVDEKDILCLSILIDEVSDGPSITLGNSQQRDFYIEYDLEQNKFGFRAKQCI